jgi:hypothetical protein
MGESGEIASRRGPTDDQKALPGAAKARSWAAFQVVSAALFYCGDATQIATNGTLAAFASTPHETCRSPI